MPVDIVYVTHHDDEEPTYDGYVDLLREQLLNAYAVARVSLR